MRSEIAIVGDVHGNLGALEILIDKAANRAATFVFVGDYINRGSQSAMVLDYLIHLSRGPRNCIFLKGNHEAEFLAFLKGGSIVKFLLIGGAATLSSYVADSDMLEEADYRSLVPDEHVQFLRELVPYYQHRELLVTHSLTDPTPPQFDGEDRALFHVAGHVPQASREPSITDSFCLLDTGCGTWQDGPLTCFFWPSRTWIQAT